MTFTQIYDQVILLMYGERVGANAPPAAVATMLQGANGVIDNCARKIMEEDNFHFMEAVSTTAIVIGTGTYALPTDYKEMIQATVLTSTGVYSPILLRMITKERLAEHRDPTATASYPTSYEIFADTIYLDVLPQEAGTLTLRYYKYLPRVVAMSDHNDLTDSMAGADAIIYRVCNFIATFQKDANMVSYYDGKAQEALDKLKRLDNAYRYSDYPNPKMVVT